MKDNDYEPDYRCGRCGHFIYAGGVWDNDWDEVRMGHCTLQPKWLEVKSNHYCGQWIDDDQLSRAPAARNETAERKWRWRQEEKDQQKRAIKAEKLLKEARKTIRDLKSRLAGG